MQIQQNICLKKYSSFRIGGDAEYFVEVKSLDELEQALNFAKEKKIKYFILGGGSNLLISDNGFDGLAIKMSNYDIKVDGDNLIVGAGCSLAYAINFAHKNNLVGLAPLYGIPGTVGGAVFGNAGAYGRSMGDYVEHADTMRIPCGYYANNPLRRSLHDSSESIGQLSKRGLPLDGNNVSLFKPQLKNL